MSLRYLTSQEAADYLDCTRQHVSHLFRSGMLSGKKFGNVLMITMRSVEDYLVSHHRNVGRPLGSRDSRQRRKRPPSAPVTHKTGRVRRSIG